MIKILFIINSLAQKAGTERVMTDKINYLARRSDEYKVYILTYEQGNHPIVFPLSDNVKIFRVNVRLWNLFKFNFLKRVFLLIRAKRRFRKEFRKILNEVEPDIIDCNTYSMHLVDIIVSEGSASKTILENHAVRRTISKSFRAHNLFQHMVYGIWDKKNNDALKKFDVIVTLTENDKKEWADFDNVVVIPNVLSHYPNNLSLSKKGKSVISVGRLYIYKSYNSLIRIWQKVIERYPDWHLDIYGDGQEEKSLEGQIREYHLESYIEIHSPILDIFQKYMESDFLLSCSQWEGFGLVFIEAMSCGIPCVVYDCPYGPSGIIKDGEDGFLIKINDDQSMINRIFYLIEHEEERIKMGLKAHENVKRYLTDNIMPTWEKLFKSIVNSK